MVCDVADPFHEVKRKRDKKKDVSNHASWVLLQRQVGLGGGMDGNENVLLTFT